MTFSCSYVTFLEREDKMKSLDKMSLEELCAAEQAAAIVRKHYEDKSATYRGVSYSDIENDKDYDTYKELSAKLAYFNAFRLKIIREMEDRLIQINEN